MDSIGLAVGRQSEARDVKHYRPYKDVTCGPRPQIVFSVEILGIIELIIGIFTDHCFRLRRHSVLLVVQ